MDSQVNMDFTGEEVVVMLESCVCGQVEAEIGYLELELYREWMYS